MNPERGLALVGRPPGEVVLEEREAPRPGPGQVPIRPGVAGLCGTDLDTLRGPVSPRGKVMLTVGST